MKIYVSMFKFFFLLIYSQDVFSSSYFIFRIFFFCVFFRTEIKLMSWGIYIHYIENFKYFFSFQNRLEGCIYILKAQDKVSVFHLIVNVLIPILFSIYILLSKYEDEGYIVK